MHLCPVHITCDVRLDIQRLVRVIVLIVTNSIPDNEFKIFSSDETRDFDIHLTICSCLQSIHGNVSLGTQCCLWCFQYQVRQFDSVIVINDMSCQIINLQSF